jgi:hypothetical protein
MNSKITAALTKPFRRSEPPVRYALCERVTATGTSPHHIRVLTAAGMLKSGGADTLALCDAKVAWDTSELLLADLPRILANQHASFHVCGPCAKAAPAA